LTATASESERFEMKGKGCAGSTARGVRMGKRFFSNSSERWRRSEGFRSSQRRSSRPWALRAGRELPVEQPPLAAEHRPHHAVDFGQLLAGGPVVRRQLADVARQLLLQAAHPLHEELVQVALEDGDELQPFEKRRLRVLRLVEHPGVEVEPRDLAIEEEGLRFEPLRGRRDRFGAEAFLGFGHRDRPRSGPCGGRGPRNAELHSAIVPGSGTEESL